MPTHEDTTKSIVVNSATAHQEIVDGVFDGQLSKHGDYLSYDEQLKIASKLFELTKTVSLREKILFCYTPELGAISSFFIFFLSWRAGYRGYHLQKFDKARFISILPCLVFPVNGYLGHSLIHERLVEPYRRESGWYYASRYAIYHQFGVFSCIAGPIVLTFLFASRLNLLPIPDGMHKPGIREIAVKVFYTRVKPFMRPIAISAVASTALMSILGFGAYYQSCNLLAKMKRKTLGLREAS